ncbi:hypothetical protein CRI88_14875 [Lysinibacillus fusiformis]|uniref:Permease n=1 Tax=Lysinibacillus fusiformis TaxID=28031 RepID=A0A2I0UY13_9BACI|nr:hypothetical protein CRI88_14875 [Lysinibacillus fusiformis]
MVILRSLINELLQLRWNVLGFVIFIYCFGIRRTIIESYAPVNAWDLLIILLSDVNLIIYFVLPFLLYFYVTFLVKGFEYHILIRLGSYKKWVLIASKKILLYLTLTIIVWLLVAFIMSIGLPFASEWSSGSKLFEPTAIMRQYFDLPLLALLYQIVMFVITTFIILMSVTTIYVFLQSWRWISFVVTVLYIFSFVSWKLFPEYLAKLSLSNYVVMFQTLNLWNNTLTIPLIAIVSLGLIYLAVQFKDGKQIVSFTSFQTGIVVYLFVLVLGTYFMADTRSNTVIDLFLLNFFGTSSEGYTFLSYLYYIVIFFGFLYLAQIYLASEFSELSYYKIIRYNSMFKWMGEWLRNILLMAILYLFFIFILTLTVAYFKGIEFSFRVTVVEDMKFTSLLYHFFINGFLQISIYILLSITLQIVSKSSSTNLVTIGIFIALLFPGYKYIPVGLNGYSHLIYGTSPMIVSLYLILIVLVEGVCIFYLLNKKYIFEGV